MAKNSSHLLDSANALISYVVYIGKLLVPYNLSVLYLSDVNRITKVGLVISLAVMVSLCWLSCRAFKVLPYVAIGWGWYLITLVPVIGIVPVGLQAMADRYSYVPSVGLCIMAVWGAGHVVSNARGAVAVACLILLTVYAGMSWLQIGYWQNSYTLFSHAVSIDNRNWLAHYNLGVELLRLNRFQEALGHFEQTIALNPGFVQGYNNAGKAHFMAGNYQEAIRLYRMALGVNPGHELASYNLGVAYMVNKDYDSAYKQVGRLEKLNAATAQRLRLMIEAQQH